MTPDKQNLIKDREELFFLLAEAAEFEHTVMCSYLYALMTLKRVVDDTVSEDELIAIERWRKQLRIVALEEMLHLSLVNNMLAAFGSAPHFGKPNFPVPAGRFPADLELNLAPFNESTLQHFMFIERPLEIDIPDGTSFRHAQHYHREIAKTLFSPTATDYPSQGYLYHTIANGIDFLAQKLGQEVLFAGQADAQVSGAQFALPGLFPITDLASAHRAIEEIVLQGEGAPAHSEDSHYARFAAVRQELAELKRARPEFTPARLAATNPLLNDPVNPDNPQLVTHPLAQRVVDLGNCLYTLMLRTFSQVFAPNPLPQPLRTGLAQSATALMYALTTVGEAATTLPLKTEEDSLRAGLNFDLPGSIGQLVQRCAAQVLSERAAELAGVARELEKKILLPGVADSLDAITKKFAKLHRDYEGVQTTVAPVASATQLPTTTKSPATLVTNPDNPNEAGTDKIYIKYDTKRCIHSRNCVLNAPRVFLANVVGPWLHPEETTPERMEQIARDCPSGAITYHRLDGSPDEQLPEVNVLRVRENGPYAVHAHIALGEQEPLNRVTLCRCGKSSNKPFCDGTHLAVGFVATGERAVIDSEPLKNRAGELTIDPTHNGPLEFTGNLEICGGTGHTIQRVQTARLCRCGGSANKPFCDNTHVRIGFNSGS
jgi:CDGSH-type Zn-finger protein/uncharacterized Fe-S cluster protein YjdI